MEDEVVGLIVGLFGFAVMLAFIIFIGFLYWRIAAKAGYSGAMGLLMFVPLANIVMIIIFAFSEWPIQRELKELRGENIYGQSDYKG